MKRIVFLVFTIAISLVIFAQKESPTSSWEKKVHDFGQFNEDAGVQKAKFEFENTGDAPLFITNVRATCGCTATEYSKEPVQPGGKGYVIVAYNPAHRPGKFNKSVTVTTNEFQPTSVLRITGDVIPKPIEQ